MQLALEQHGSQVTRKRTRNYQLAHYEFTARVHGRRHPAHAPGAGYEFILPLAGTAQVRESERWLYYGAHFGYLCMPDTAFDYVVEPGSRVIVLGMHPIELHHRFPRAAGGTKLPLGSGLGRIGAAVLDGVVQQVGLSEEDVDVACSAFLDLMRQLAHSVRQDELIRYDIESAVRSYIRAHADQPALTGSDIAAALGWSLRQIQRSLHESGTTPRKLIKSERLRLAHQRLGDPNYRHWTIAELAHATGFASASSLSTAFRRQFGVTPRQLRTSKLARTGRLGAA
ncbi:AraC-like DNA-binding protein [Tamaricihabitans halophyticus]|uniref:AraC-like DNA-binding protein n=1 Tax=Tamaricihabitans halophyticus TaxID=1262583 RepID=A0A4V2SV29_9PSEU|nr:AraC family transcriptional regulator [Tamaricihabitans halophyticus]TCP56896.1 AraC-like DNA-binding protein [Tamaricihabitans halophyticus]